MEGLEKLQKQYSAANQAYISARCGIEEALAILSGPNGDSGVEKAKRLLQHTLAEIKDFRKEF